MTDISQRELGEMITDIKYLKACCERVEKDLDASKTRSTATLTTVIILLIGTVINLVLYYAK